MSCGANVVHHHIINTRECHRDHHLHLAWKVNLDIINKTKSQKLRESTSILHVFLNMVHHKVKSAFNKIDQIVVGFQNTFKFKFIESLVLS